MSTDTTPSALPPESDSVSNSMRSALSEDFAATDPVAVKAAETEPVAPDAVEPEATPEAEPTAAEEAASLRNYARDFLNDTDAPTKYKTDEEYLRGLINARRKIGERDQYAELGRQVAPELEEYRRWKESQTKAVQATLPTPAQVANAPGAPEFDPAWEYQVQQPDCPIEIKQKLQKYNAFVRKKLLDIATKPPEEVFGSIIDQAVKRAIEASQQVIGAQAAVNNEFNVRTEFARANTSWLYVDGDPNKGLTPHATRLDEYYSTPVCQSLPTEADKLDYALTKLQVEWAAQRERAAAAQASKPKPQARHKPNVAMPPSPGSGELVPGDDLRTSLMRDLGLI